MQPPAVFIFYLDQCVYLYIYFFVVFMLHFFCKLKNVVSYHDLPFWSVDLTFGLI